ncbi:TPA: hypothetical protein H2R31_002937 [Salmonella enterica]|nr:hypothetical protein [Salmonella enterica]
MGWWKHVTHSVSHAFKHPMKSLEGEIHRENKQIASAVNVGKLLQGVGLAPKPPAQDTSTADALRELAAQQAQQQQQEQAAQQQAQQQQQQAAQQAQQAQEQARQEALRRKKMSSLLATSPSGLSTSLLGSAASAYGKPTLGG